MRLSPNNMLTEEKYKYSETHNGAGSTELSSNPIRKGLTENICACTHPHIFPPLCAKQSSEIYRQWADFHPAIDGLEISCLIWCRGNRNRYKETTPQLKQTEQVQRSFLSFSIKFCLSQCVRNNNGAALASEPFFIYLCVPVQAFYTSML